ncbi:hypothetical protein PQU92_06685 [Asticcacaulis sp. BYS171W]|uniref:Uncharacterized protein n=1 Tax=Asticcacaulis aquaticus TaxID=2984212 RepID=A0ABT5HSC6_9CAUL|nr:hypothetical protein [Asticcacaulis aquaticus]MDC7682954.1 hypothetical protein [Asticcacaulis aquaticus]
MKLKSLFQWGLSAFTGAMVLTIGYSAYWTFTINYRHGYPELAFSLLILSTIALFPIYPLAYWGVRLLRQAKSPLAPVYFVVLASLFWALVMTTWFYVGLECNEYDACPTGQSFFNPTSLWVGAFIGFILSVAAILIRRPYPERAPT